MRQGKVSQEEAGWQYKPMAGSAAGADLSADTPAELDASLPDSVEWTASEFIAHEKGFGWYAMLALAAVFITACIYMLTKDKFAAAVAAIMIAILAISGSHKPRVIAYRVDATGITVNGKLYPFSAYKSFSVPDEGALTSILLVPLKHVSFPVGAYLSPDTQDEVLEIVSRYLPLERHETTTFDRLMRHLRF